MNEQLFICAMIMAFILLIKIISELVPGIQKKKPSLSAPGYTLFYSDQKKHRQKNGVIYSKLLISEAYGLSGKPDLVFVNRKGCFLPVELKSGTIGDAEEPHEGDVMQLAAYFLILEDLYGAKVKTGRLIYRDCMFVIRNNRKLRRRLLSIVADMRDMLQTGEQEVEPSFVKCKHCLCRSTVCEHEGE